MGLKMYRNDGLNVNTENVETFLAGPVFVFARILPRIPNATFKYTVPWLDVGINLTKLTGIRIKKEWANTRALLSAFQPAGNISLWLKTDFLQKNHLQNFSNSLDKLLGCRCDQKRKSQWQRFRLLKQETSNCCVGCSGQTSV